MKRSGIVEADVCVVGAGIVGLAHALEARRLGLEVVVLERDARAVGASVRNFGHCFISAMADGEALDYALLARRRWLELGGQAGLEVHQGGSLVVARHEDELELLEGVARDERRGARLIGAGEVSRLAPIPAAGLRGALHATLDVRVDPRQAVVRLAALFEQDPGARILWGVNVHGAGPGRIEADRLVVRAPIAVICPGPGYPTLPADLRPERHGLTLCRLQMLRVNAPGARQYLPALLTGLSLLRYPAFTAQAGFERVRARIEAEHPELVAAGIHLIVTQLPGGDLIVGDTHDYGDPPAPFACERLDRLVLAEASRLLGTEALHVRERWQGIYPYAPGDPFMVTAPYPGVRVVEVVSGVGMTTAMGLAPRVLAELLKAKAGATAPASPVAAPPPSVAARVDCGS
ncbi:MAG: TIGR03364 family FAD-dependent oxidoreductase [Solirubrobacterales bacterium]|nr:TIGR03364 family FAD-dependent oxidoreductase [Solirubrobacterales bacterium]